MNEPIIDRYDYLKVTVDEEFCSQYMDGYKSFGWKPDENMQPGKKAEKVTLYMKRSQNILNKVELTRLQQHYESCMKEIVELEQSKDSIPTIVSLCCGLLGCLLVTGAVFASTAEPPAVLSMALAGGIGILLWIAAYFSQNIVRRKRTEKVSPLIEAKYDEAYKVCDKAFRLL